MVSLHTGRKLLIVTLVSSSEIDRDKYISFCTSEEADQRLVRHRNIKQEQMSNM